MPDKIEMPTEPEEWPEDKPFAPPEEGTMILRPFKELMRFWPNDQADRQDVQWLHQYEQRYIAPLGIGIAQVFHVDLINDDEYLGMPDEAKATYLSCIMTRSQVREIRQGTWEWYPICVVVRKCIVAAVQVRVDPANQKIEIPMALVWSQEHQEYAPIRDDKAGKIENPAVLLDIFSRYAALEFNITGPAKPTEDADSPLIVAP